jgi:hypothetical protein
MRPVASLLFGAGLVGLSAGGAIASDVNGNYAVLGAGAQSCASFRQAAVDGGPTLLNYISWLQGYLSHMNRTTAETYDAMPVSEATGFAQMVLRVCGQDDTQSVELAALKTLNVFAPLRVQAESPLVQISWNGQQLSVRQETIRTVQAELRERGLYDSAVDGTFGPKTAEAIVAFQKTKGIPETGLPDAITLANLLIEG